MPPFFLHFTWRTQASRIKNCRYLRLDKKLEFIAQA
jgi:hypothetical protein